MLEQLVKTGKFKLSDLPFTKSERHTVRRVCRELESHSWLSRESENSAIWRAGPKAELLLNIHPDIIERAKN